MDDLFEMMMESEQLIKGGKSRERASKERTPLDRSWLREALGASARDGADWLELDHAIASGSRSHYREEGDEFGRDPAREKPEWDLSDDSTNDD